MISGRWGKNMQKNEIGHILHHLHKTWRGKNRQNHNEEIYIGFGNDFLHDTKSRSNESKKSTEIKLHTE